jgi:hypothetical protein
MSSVLLVLTLFVSIGIYRLFKVIQKELNSPVHDFPGPPSSNPLFGNFLQVFDAVRIAAGSSVRGWISLNEATSIEPT